MTPSHADTEGVTRAQGQSESMVTGPDVRFYHLTRHRLEQALPQLLARSLERDWRAVVRTGSVERRSYLSNVLWTAQPDSFLPHGTEEDGKAALQPIWITEQDENPNGGSVLFLTDGTDTEAPTLFETVCILFDGNDPDAVAVARRQWSTKKAQGFRLAYWAQDERGGWTKKMET